MTTRHSILTLAVGAFLAVGPPVAQAHLVSDDSVTSHSSAASAQALKALNMRWQAIAKYYRSEHPSQGLRPDDRAGARGA